ncbi:uncharacterized protein LOC134751747 [Cydia strobilella]|uniref:uncharacterized protein LOC134751747 n=1 Tax=Cydia strobilella TaxID=1100964 RepID=UPI003005BE32
MEIKVEKTRVDSEYLILTIKKHECIWNKNCPEYHTKGTKEDAWNQICEELIPGWQDLAEPGKLTKQWELKKRWNNIRDYYKKDLALQLSGAIGQTKRKRYVFSETLDFLRPLMDQSQIEKQEEQDEQEIYLDEHLYSSDEDNSVLKRKEVRENEIVEDKHSYAIPTRNRDLEDSDWLFLRSLLSDMKEMNRAQKLEFKMGVLKLYKDIVFQDRDLYEDDSKIPLK